jgi:RNA polymerase sigma-70 factor (ECF subfamily)
MNISERIEQIYRDESRQVFATLVRLLGDLDLAEDAMHDAFTAAVEQWPQDGVPSNPRSWLVSVGRFKGVDSIRKKARLSELTDRHALPEADEPEDVQDDELRLIFTCCHPALSPDARVALTLREVCGLSTEEIARAFLAPVATLAQRIVRAKSKIRDAGIPFKVPSSDDLPERLDGVLQVVYLVFNEGYSASSGESVTRADLSHQAIRLGRLLLQLLPDEPEVGGLLALMLLHESRRRARSAANGDLILLDQQDRTLWDQALIDEGQQLVTAMLSTGRAGPYTLQAAIAAVHAGATHSSLTDWDQIVQLYDVLLTMHPSPVVELNRSVAVTMRDGPAAGLAIIDRLVEQGDLENFHLLHAARADYLERLGSLEQAKMAYQRAIELAKQHPERRHLQARLDALP